SCGNGNVVELTCDGGAIESNHFIVKIGDGDAGASGIFEVPDVHTHSGASFSVSAEGQAGFDGGILEFPITQVAIKFVGLSIVGDEEIGPSVLIEIEHGDTQGFGAGVKNAAGGGDVFK